MNGSDPKITPFKVTLQFLDGMVVAWGREPVCSMCGGPYRIGERVMWLRPARTGKEHGHVDCIKERAAGKRAEAGTA